MKVDVENATIELERAQFMRLKGATGTRILCRAGTLWVTQEGVPKDDFLGPGESLTIVSGGIALVEGVGRSGASLSIQAPRRRTAGDSSASFSPRVAAC